MTSATPGFVGSRLTEAREARQLTMTALADLVHVSRQIVSEYEKGTKNPSSDVLMRLASTLAMPMQFFMRQPLPENKEHPVFFRSMAAATLQARQRAARRSRWLRDVVQWLRQFIIFPCASFPSFEPPADPRSLREEEIEQAALEARRHWSLGDEPIPNIVGLLEAAGGFVARQELDADKLDSLSEWPADSPQPYFILGTDKASAVRSRMDAAHELGHMILHRNVPASLHNTQPVFNLIEHQAFSFAGAFLLPESAFAEEFGAHLGNITAFIPLKSRWLVSIQGMLMRASALRLVSPERQQNLWRSLSRQGWRLREPLDDTLEPELPRLLRRSFDLVLSKGIVDRQTLEVQLCLRAADIESVCGLPAGYLESASQPTKVQTQAPDPESAPRILRLRDKT
jgi:Zn-dependent peptidase ImmA (M78 family)/DNA-binding XRE family transcriptional regulator